MAFFQFEHFPVVLRYPTNLFENQGERNL